MAKRKALGCDVLGEVRKAMRSLRRIDAHYKRIARVRRKLEKALVEKGADPVALVRSAFPEGDFQP